MGLRVTPDDIGPVIKSLSRQSSLLSEICSHVFITKDNFALLDLEKGEEGEFESRGVFLFDGDPDRVNQERIRRMDSHCVLIARTVKEGDLEVK